MSGSRSLCSNPKCGNDDRSNFWETDVCGEDHENEISIIMMVCGKCSEEMPKEDWEDKMKSLFPVVPRQRKLKQKIRDETIPTVEYCENNLRELTLDDVSLPSGSGMSRDFSTDSIKEILSVAPCSKCGSDKTPVDDTDSTRQDSLVWHCRSCDLISGVDDTFTMEDMHKVMDEVADSLEKATVKTTECPGGCGNDDINKFIFDFDGQQLILRCAICDHRQSINIENNEQPTIPEETEDDLKIQCDCGNVEPDGFAVYYHPSGVPFKIICHVCDAELILDLSLARDEPYGSQPSNEETFQPPKGRMEIRKISQLAPGDHIGWHQSLAYWHHAIVVKVGTMFNKVQVIHYDGPAKELGGKGVIQEGWLDIDLKKEALYRYDYETCHSTDTVLKRARSRLGETKYGLLSNNCEHFAQWCKTGVARSCQVESFVDACKNIKTKMVTFATKDSTKLGIKMIKKVVSKYSKIRKVPQIEGAIKGAPAVVGKVGTDLAKQEAKNVAGGLCKLDYAAMGLVIAIEGYRTAKSVHKMYKKKEAGDISQQEFVRFTVKRTTQGVGGASGTIAGGVLGQMLIPIPVLGSLAGATVGAFLGEGVGAFLGRKIVQTYDGK